MLGGVVFAVVHAHDHGDVLTLGRSGNDDLLGAGGDVALGFFSVGEQTGRLDDDLDAQLGPGELGGSLGGDNEDLLAVHDEHIVIGLVSRGLLGADGAVKTTLGRVVLEQVGQIVGRDDIAHRDDVERRAEKALFHESAEHEAANATETIDGNFD